MRYLNCRLGHWSFERCIESVMCWLIHYLHNVDKNNNLICCETRASTSHQTLISYQPHDFPWFPIRSVTLLMPLASWRVLRHSVCWSWDELLADTDHLRSHRRRNPPSKLQKPTEKKKIETTMSPMVPRGDCARQICQSLLAWLGNERRIRVTRT